MEYSVRGAIAGFLINCIIAGYYRIVRGPLNVWCYLVPICVGVPLGTHVGSAWHHWKLDQEKLRATRLKEDIHEHA